MCLCIFGIFSKTQAGSPRTLDGQGDRFTHSDKQTWSPRQNLLSVTIADEWHLNGVRGIFTNDFLYYKQVKLCFSARTNIISVMSAPREFDPADVIVATYLAPDFKYILFVNLSAQ